MEHDKAKINKYLVAFLDILGFSKQVTAVQTSENLNKIRETLLHLHKRFEKTPTKSPPLDREVVALSDALIVAINLDSKYANLMGLVDLCAFETYVLAVKQAECVKEGIFLRGGIAMGYYHHEEDIIISDALVRAYEAEQQSCYPIIALDKDFYNFFTEHPEQNNYEPEIAPKNNLFSEMQNLETGKTEHFVDYLRTILHDYGETNSELDYLEAHKSLIKSELSKHKSIIRLVPVEKRIV